MQANHTSCTQLSKKIICSELGGKTWLCPIIKMFPSLPPPNKEYVWFHWIFSLYIFTHSLTSIGGSLLSYVSLRSFYSNKQKLSRNIRSVTDLPCDLIICCHRWGPVIFVSALKEFWGYLIHPPCVITEDTELERKRTLFKNVRERQFHKYVRM